MAVNKSKARGTAFETAVKNVLTEWGFDVRRNPLTGKLDSGDLTIKAQTHPWKAVVQCKDTQRIDLPGAIDDAHEQRDNAKADFGFAIIKRRGKNVNRSYVAMELGDLEFLLVQAGWK
jgi:hypothetical protein